MTNFDIAVARTCNAILMHMLVESEVRQALKLWKYALNHVEVKSSMRDLYHRTCGDRFPLPHDPSLLTNEMLSKAFRNMKRFHSENNLICKHDLDENIEFLLSRVDSEYVSKQVLENG